MSHYNVPDGVSQDERCPTGRTWREQRIRDSIGYCLCGHGETCHNCTTDFNPQVREMAQQEILLEQRNLLLEAQAIHALLTARLKGATE